MMPIELIVLMASRSGAPNRRKKLGGAFAESGLEEARPHTVVPSRVAPTTVVWTLASCLLFSGCTPNAPPSSAAGPDRTVESGERVTLTGEGMDADGSVQHYRWEQVEGRPVSIKNPHHDVVEFVAPVVDALTTLMFRLTVADNDGAAASDEVSVAVEPYGVLNVSVSGTVNTLGRHVPVGRAKVTVSQYDDGKLHVVGTADTDSEGRFTAVVPARPGRLNFKAEAEGFVPQSAVVVLGDDAEDVAVNLGMVRVQVVQQFEAADGTDVGVEGRSLVSLPANAVVTELGKEFAGVAVAAVTVLDPSRNPAVMPGDFVRWVADTEVAEPIESYGAMNVMFTTEGGESLQLGGGQRARVAIPLASGRTVTDTPATMPLFFWSVEMGYWIKEGRATLQEV